jgi:hypothetical protein
MQGTNDSGERFPERMPYSAIIQREYVYYNQNNDVDKEKTREKEIRVVEAPKQALETSDSFKIKVDMSDIEE